MSAEDGNKKAGRPDAAAERQTRGTEGTGEPELPPWTPFIRTGQVVRDPSGGLPDGIVWENSRYVVVRRECGVVETPLIWLSIHTVANDARHDWRELQRIKNELVGLEAEAVELYPAESRLVDTANQFHLWCLPNQRFPFGFQERLVSEGTKGVSQRPFEEESRPADLTRLRLTDIGQALLLTDGEGLTNLRGKFPMGKLVATTGATDALQQAGQDAFGLLLRHWQGDWGDIDQQDRRANQEALRNGERLLSAYTLAEDVTVWVITEADRSATTLLLPDEY